ncbi:MAG: cytochrome c biogenesis protein DipZ, partial [Gemmatimonadales bacterium]
LLAFLGGILTILSPCILPIIPLVFSRADRSMTRETIPMLAGLAVVFAIVASLATASAGWIARANEIGRIGALGILAVVSVSLLLPAFAETIARPFARLGERIETLERNRNTVVANLVIGGAVGLLWSPCAGPILGLVIAGAALQGSSTDSIAMFVAFATGAAMSLAVALFAGGRMLQRMKRYAGLDAWVRRSLGAVGLAGVFVIAAGWDQQLFARGSAVETAGAEKFLVKRLSSAKRGGSSLDIGKSIDEFTRERSSMMLPDEGPAPDFDGGGPWINSSGLKLADLRGKVVMVEFWTFACYNCLNALPHVKALEAKYRDAGLVVIGVHTPELPHEKIEANVRSQVKSLGIVYPVVIDNGYKIWNSFHNQYWPAAYFIDASGRIRYHHFGEGKYEEQDQVVAQLLSEARQKK